MARSAVYLAVLLAVFEVGSCLRCYQCHTSLTDKTCGDPFAPTNQLRDCADSVTYNSNYLYSILPPDVFGSTAGAPKFCHKIVLESGNVIRTCLDGNPNDMNYTCRKMQDSSKLFGPEKRIKYCGACSGESCNGSGSLTFSLPLAFASLLAYFLLYKQ